MKLVGGKTETKIHERQVWSYNDIEEAELHFEEMIRSNWTCNEKDTILDPIYIYERVTVKR